MKRLLILLLRGYQLGISPYLGNNCRFHPSCSSYAMQAIHEHGALKGGILAARRLGRCHSWHAGGIDPVPSVEPASEHSTKSTAAAPRHTEG